MKDSKQVALLRAEIETLKARIALLELRFSPPIYPAPLIPLSPSVVPFQWPPWVVTCSGDTASTPQ